MTPGLHPQIERFAQYAQAEMSSEQAAEILGVSKRTILDRKSTRLNSSH